MRRVLLAGLILLLPASVAPPAQAARRGFTEAGYWAVADRILPALEERWDATRGAYVSGLRGASGRVNANMLLIHAVAAERGHRGPSRQDERARRMVEHLVRRPGARLVRVNNTTVCWSAELDSGLPGHISLDSQIAEALDYAWRARAVLGLGPTTRRRIRRALDRCAHHPGWRYPSGLSNQINWNAQLYAHAAHVTGHNDVLRRDYRRHLLRFARGITRPMPGMRIANLGPGYAFHYSPSQGTSAPLNLDAPEYANIVVSALGYHAQARRAGMRPLPPHARRLLRSWVTRILGGAWTHAGYLNWDTGYGLGRWHSGQYWAFAQQGLLAIAQAPAFWADRRTGRWAKALFDRGLELYVRWARAAGTPAAPQFPFGVHAQLRDHDLYAARMAGNAVRAIALGLGRRTAEDPPPLYAFDPDTRRLAVSTPRYSTAIVPHTQGAFPYGGVDLARLYGPGQRAVGGIGGMPPAAFGAIVRDRLGHTLLSSQRPRASATLRLLRSPLGPVSAGDRYPARVHAGPFTVLVARGHVGGSGVGITTIHRFERAAVTGRWSLSCLGGCAARAMTVHFPTWGRAAKVRVTRRDGTVRELRAGAPEPLRAGDRIALSSGYAVEPLAVPDGTVLALVATHRSAFNPRPGPTLALRLARGERFLRARIVPSPAQPS